MTYENDNYLGYGLVNETFKLFPHHTQDVEKGHTDLSVEEKTLKSAWSFLHEHPLSEATNFELNRTRNHLSSHAANLGIKLNEAGVESSDDRNERIRHDFSHQFGSSHNYYWDAPWVVDVFDTYVVARGDARFWQYNYTESDNVFVFDDEKIEVRRVYVELTDSNMGTPTATTEAEKTIEEKELVLAALNANIDDETLEAVLEILKDAVDDGVEVEDLLDAVESKLENLDEKHKKKRKAKQVYENEPAVQNTGVTLYAPCTLPHYPQVSPVPVYPYPYGGTGGTGNDLQRQTISIVESNLSESDTKSQ